MTREEAIERLNIHKSTSVFVDSIAEAIDMAIEALSESNGHNLHSGDIISRADAIKAVNKEIYHSQTDRKTVVAVLSSLPSAEAVEVVRCKDCKHYSVEGKTTQFGWCNALEMPIDETDYCSRAVRREP